MKVYVESILNCSPDDAWNEVGKTSLLSRVLRPIATLKPVDGPFPELWATVKTMRLRVYLFHVIPIGVRTLRIESIDREARQIQTRETDVFFRRFDHRIMMSETDDGQTLYADEIDLDAGWLTPLAALFIRAVFGHRHRRWRAVARDLRAVYGRAESALISTR